MTFGVKNKAVVGPAFLSGWGAIAYGASKGKRKLGWIGNVGMGGVVLGGVLARAPMDRGAPASVGKKGKALFLAGWTALASGVAQKNGGSRQNYASALLGAGTVVAGATLIRKNALGGGKLPAVLPPAVFGLGWYLFTRELLK